MQVPADHPRRESLILRENVVEALHSGVLAEAGLAAHGRGEAFDYLLGEKTTKPALKAIRATAAALLTAKRPVVSVNGNVAALCPEETVQLAKVVGAKLEVNLFYESIARERAIEEVLHKAGAEEVLGVGEAASALIEKVSSRRRQVDPRGISSADVILVPIEDGDRTEALVEMGKTVVSIDLNPLSRTAQKSHITIVDNIVRCMPLLIEEAKALSSLPPQRVTEIYGRYNNSETLAESLELIKNRLEEITSNLRQGESRP
ncbi:MAG: 4-phosphopantoate--beta-alanine ligase [Candidatus Geothermarchaeales archaeon]